MLARLLPLVLLLTACSGAGGDGRVQVVAGAYPFAWLAEQVGGDAVEVTDLVKPGAEPHDVELTPRQTGVVQEAPVVVLLKGFQPAVDDAVKDNALDLGEAMRQEGSDPHVWLDPQRMALGARAIASRLGAVDPGHADDYAARADALAARLTDLDGELRAQLTDCARREVVTSHAAFGYLAERYGLEQKGISGFEPDAEPSPADVAEVARYAREKKVTTVFFETLVDPGVAQVIADEIGADTATLDPVEGVSGSDDYLSVMRRNGRALRTALGCTG